MCDFVSPKVKQFKGERVFWKVVSRSSASDVAPYLRSGPIQGIPIKVGRWRKAERLSPRAHSQFRGERKLEGNFFGFNVFRTREQAEAYRLEFKGQIARVAAKGGYRDATTDERVPCLLVEWIKILEIFE